MLLFFPCNTDAPIYHRPFATVGLIIANVVLHITSLFLHPGQIQEYILSFNTLNPIQWITASFLHVGVIHLLGNMLFLWVFGLVVEGKLGWWKFLLLCLAATLFQGALTQSIFFLFIDTSSPGALGASGVIYSLIAMGILWAPHSNIHFVFGAFGRFGLYSYNYLPIPIYMVFFMYIGMDILEMIFSIVSSGFLHSLGAIVGIGIGLPMLLLGWVDCEGQDIISVISGKKFEKPLSAKEKEQLAKEKEEAKKEIEDEINNALNFINNLLKNGRPNDAFLRYDRLLRQHKNILKPDPNLLVRLAKALISENSFDRVLYLKKHYYQFSESTTRNYLSLFSAIAFIKKDQPKSALTSLQDFSPEFANDKTKKAASRTREAAKRMLNNGFLELDMG